MSAAAAAFAAAAATAAAEIADAAGATAAAIDAASAAVDAVANATVDATADAVVDAVADAAADAAAAAVAAVFGRTRRSRGPPKHLDPAAIVDGKRARKPSAAVPFQTQLRQLQDLGPDAPVVAVGSAVSWKSLTRVEEDVKARRPYINVSNLYKGVSIQYKIDRLRDGSFAATPLSFFKDLPLVSKAGSEWKATRGLVDLVQGALQDAYETYNVVWVPGPATVTSREVRVKPEELSVIGESVLRSVTLFQ
jgi:hypothetical protein